MRTLLLVNLHLIGSYDPRSIRMVTGWCFSLQLYRCVLLCRSDSVTVKVTAKWEWGCLLELKDDVTSLEEDILSHTVPEQQVSDGHMGGGGGGLH